MITSPINPNLVNIVKELSIGIIDSLSAGEHFIIDDFRITTSHYGISECIQLNSEGIVIDGFVIKHANYYTYRGKKFFELLGSSETANPIDKDLYIGNEDIILESPDSLFLKSHREYREKKKMESL